MENPVRFFTATMLKWQHLLKPDKYKQVIVDSMKFLVDDNRAWIYGFVVMPNHIHLLWRINNGHEEKSVQRDFLKFTAQTIKSDLTANHPKVLDYFKSTQKDRKYQFWERRPYSSTMYNRLVVEQKLDYMHNNPVVPRWKLAEEPGCYHFSSARYYLLNERQWDFITHYTEHI